MSRKPHRDPQPAGDPAGPTATYAYCVVRAASAPAADGAPAGPPGAGAARPLELGGGLWLIAAPVPLADYSAEAIETRLDDLGWVSERALAHEAVVEHFAAAAPAVPLKLFTLFDDDRRARQQMEAERPRLEGALERVAGRAEWGLKVFFSPESARREEPAAAPASGTGGAGTAFLERKLQARRAAAELAAGARAAADELYRSLAPAAVAAVRKPVAAPETGARLLLEAAFLVDSERAAEFERAVAERAADHGGAGLSVTLTGPWPPYHFVGGDAGE